MFANWFMVVVVFCDWMCIGELYAGFLGCCFWLFYSGVGRLFLFVFSIGVVRIFRFGRLVYLWLVCAGFVLLCGWVCASVDCCCEFAWICLCGDWFGLFVVGGCCIGELVGAVVLLLVGCSGFRLLLLGVR